MFPRQEMKRKYLPENQTEYVDLLVIGGGAAGMGAALSAAGAGKSVLLCERDPELGGILNQCTHKGFGHGYFREDLTGPQYAARFIRKVSGSGIDVRLGTTVLSLDGDRTALLSGKNGVNRIGFSQCVLAAGCRERTIGSLKVAGTRPAGVMTAGAAQQMMNRGGYGIGKRILILGSGDIGQIMARQLRQAGCEVVCMLEMMDHIGGMERNRRECLEAYHIPVMLRTTVEEILGEGRIRGVIARNLDTGERMEIPCDTLLTALGLIPDRTLCRKLLSISESNADEPLLPSWLHLCGNCESVHDIVDSVTREALILGRKIFT